jgi:hypothetical protein
MKSPIELWLEDSEKYEKTIAALELEEKEKRAIREHKALYEYLAFNELSDINEYKQMLEEHQIKYLKNLMDREYRMLLCEAVKILKTEIDKMQRNYERLVECQNLN